MNAAVFAYSRQGCKTATEIKNVLQSDDVVCYTLEKFDADGFLPITKPSLSFYGDLFSQCDALVFVGSCGIAIREIAPHIKSKRTDPAVIVIDELGKYVIPVLSGHIGGANALTRQIAQQLHAVPVITTATDINRKFSVDAWASEQGFSISSMDAAKAVSAAILEQNIPMVCDFPVLSDYPAGIIPGTAGKIGISVSYRQTAPFGITLRLIPRILHLGIGCRKGTEISAIQAAVFHVLEEQHIDLSAVKCVASIDLKAKESGLLEFCRNHRFPVHFYSAAELLAVSGDFTSSEFVQKITGVDNVCERAALQNADHLIIRKTAHNGVTVAVAAEKLEVRFG